MITRAKLEIREKKNVKDNERLLAELNALEDVEAGEMFGEQDEDGFEEEEEEEEEEQPKKKRKKAPPKKMSKGASSSAQPHTKRGRK
jgi:ABC-type lipoprotein export system ATPase subunit